MKKSRLNVIFDKLMELIRKFRTWLARMMQRARSMPVQVSSKGKVYISATKAACIKVNTCVNNTYAFVLNLINGKNPTMGELDEGFDSALEALTNCRRCQRQCKYHNSQYPCCSMGYCNGYY